jgi:hypothetical protein
MDAKSLLGSPVSTLGYFGRQRPNPSGFCHFYACSSNLPWRSHAQYSAGSEHMVLKQRRAEYRSFAFNIRKGASATETSSKKVLEQTIPGEVILQEVSILNATDYAAILSDEVSELRGNRVSIQLVSSDQVDPGKSVNVFQLCPSNWFRRFPWCFI